MRRSILLLTVLSASASLWAQQTAGAKPWSGDGCPIGFGAQVNGRAIVRTVEDRKKNGDGPLLELMFAVHDTPRIVSASVMVHGLSSSDRYLPVSQRPDENISQRFELGGERGVGLTEAEVRMNRILFVRWAEVTDLRYADGTVWHASPEAQCRTVPSKLLLVDAMVGQEAGR
jgi:hypothetical protein